MAVLWLGPIAGLWQVPLLVSKLAIIVVVALSACSFEVSLTGTGSSGATDARPAATDRAEQPDSSPLPSDAGPALPSITHLPNSEWFAGTVDWTVPEGELVIINTSNLTIEGDGIPSGLSLAVSTQQPAGPEVAVLRLNRFEIEFTGTVRARGARPLIIIAGGVVLVNGLLNANAQLSSPGAGGALPSTGAGVGLPGQHRGAFRDSGGGGGGFGSRGGNGGDAINGSGSDALGGLGGFEYGMENQLALVGGSGGGTDGSGCAFLPGAGGGALQVFSAANITIGPDGAIAAGGGGGGGGNVCGSPGNTVLGAGTGGGSGGAIFLQAPSVDLEGFLAANGGAGGGGAGASGSGDPGQNGRITSRAQGGSTGGTFGAEGGDGAFAQFSAAKGETDDTGDGNGGGGGGGFGRIAVQAEPGGFNNAGSSSPEAIVLSL